jgi:hypothetical protein
MSTIIIKNVQIGTSGTPANNFTLYQPATPDGTVRLANGNPGSTTDVLTATSAGNVGIGTSSPGARLDVNGNTRLSNGTGFTSANSLIRQLESVAGAANQFTVGSVGFLTGAFSDQGQIVFSTNNSLGNTERARIDSSGAFMVGVTSTLMTGGISTIGYASRSGINGSFTGNYFNIQWGGSTATLWIDTTNVGNISLTSDYRIKQNIETQTAPALERVMQLRPVTYELQDYGTLFKADGVAREGFIAHELQAVIPSAVEGEKDAENQIQSLKLDALVSVLTKAIQEQQAIITALTARVEALEGAQP